jgi:protein-L-isoaspartate(D-aspartate) O-methyltransferase
MTAMQPTAPAAEFDAAKARFNMIQQQIRPWDVADSMVLDTLETLPRELFVAANQKALAYADLSLPSGGNQSGEAMLPPKVQSRLVQDAAVASTDRVLLIGTGTGFMAGMLGKLAESVVTIEINPALAQQAQSNLKQAGIANVEVITADAAAHNFKVCENKGPFDAVVLSGSVSEVPQALLDLLKVNGRLVAITGEEPVMRTTVVTRVSSTGFATAQPWDYTAPKLANFPQTRSFQF